MLHVCNLSMLYAAFEGNYLGRGGGATPSPRTSLFTFLTPSTFSICFFVEGWIHWFWGQCYTREGKGKLSLVCNKFSRASRWTESLELTFPLVKVNSKFSMAIFFVLVEGWPVLNLSVNCVGISCANVYRYFIQVFGMDIVDYMISYAKLFIR